MWRLGGGVCRDEDRRNERDRRMQEEDEQMGYAPSNPYDDEVRMYIFFL